MQEKDRCEREANSHILADKGTGAVLWFMSAVQNAPSLVNCIYRVGGQPSHMFPVERLIDFPEHSHE